MDNPIQFLISKDGERVIMASPNDNWETIKFLELNPEEWVWGSWETEYELVCSKSINYKEKILKKYRDRGNFIDILVSSKEFIDYVKENNNIDLSSTPLSKLPEGVKVVEGTLWLDGCTSLIKLPEGLKVGCGLDLTGCTSLTKLPKGLNVGGSLWLDGCTSLIKLPEGLKVGWDLDLTGCTSFKKLPKELEIEGNLWLNGCIPLREIPKGIKVGRSITK